MWRFLKTKLHSFIEEKFENLAVGLKKIWKLHGFIEKISIFLDFIKEFSLLVSKIKQAVGRLIAVGRGLTLYILNREPTVTRNWKFPYTGSLPRPRAKPLRHLTHPWLQPLKNNKNNRVLPLEIGKTQNVILLMSFATSKITKFRWLKGDWNWNY